MPEINNRLKLSKNCWFETQHFDNGNVYVWLSYIEESPAHGFSDSETNIDIGKEDAERIVAFLSEKFGI